ncbi:SPOSA6832_00744, partial [Sporobolomyces salmonicolor]
MGHASAPPAPEQSLTVTDNRTGKTINVPIEHNAIAATAFKALRKKLGKGERAEDEVEGGLRVFDPGFMNTAVIQSKITFIDGEKGILRYRGYPIEQLAEKSSFLETSYLLLYGELPTAKQFELFEREVLHHTFVHRDLEDIGDPHLGLCRSRRVRPRSESFPRRTEALYVRLVCRASDDGQADLPSPREEHHARCDGLPREDGEAICSAPKQHGLCRKLPDHLNEPNYRPNPVLAKALDTLFLLHADHEMNASAAATLQVGSTLVDPYSAVSAGAVIRMLLSIGTPDKVPEFIEKVKRKEAVLRSVFASLFDSSQNLSLTLRTLSTKVGWDTGYIRQATRAAPIADEVFAVTGKDPLLETALALRDAALKDEYFITRRLYPNVDYYSGLIYFPMDFFPVLFAVPRVVGWLSHWRQLMLQQNGVKIWRPRQLYVGEGEREFVEIGKRERKENGKSGEPTKVDHPLSKRTFLARESKL